MFLLTTLPPQVVGFTNCQKRPRTCVSKVLKQSLCVRSMIGILGEQEPQSLELGFDALSRKLAIVKHAKGILA
jgi:hypothetical protein